MGYLHGTPTYNLPQTVGTDVRDWFDTNEAFADVDKALTDVVAESASNVERITQAESDIVEHNTRITTLEGDMAVAKADIDTLESNVATLVSSTDEKFQDVYDMIDPDQEPTATASHGYVVGERFIYNDTWYRCTVEIAEGDTIVPNVNCTSINVDSELRALSASGASTESEVQQNAQDIVGLDERVTALENAPQESEIDDSVTSTTLTWSSSKINTQLGTKADGSNVYTKAQIDAMLAQIGGSMIKDFNNAVNITSSAGVVSYTTPKNGALHINHGKLSSAGWLTINGENAMYMTADGGAPNYIIEGVPSGASIATTSSFTDLSNNRNIMFIPYK